MPKKSSSKTFENIKKQQKNPSDISCGTYFRITSSKKIKTQIIKVGSNQKHKSPSEEEMDPLP